MSNHCKARNVVGALVDLLHKWCLRIHESSGLEHPIYLCNDLLRIYHVLENRLSHNGIKASVGERELVGVADDLRPRPDVNVRLDDLEVRVLGEVCHSLTEDASADD